MSNAPPPTSVPPAPPTSGGNRTYAILALLLLLGMGGLLYFKFKGDTPTPDSTPTVPSAAPTFNRDEEDIPPPPEPLPEAGPPDAGKLDKTVSGGAVNGCSASTCGEASTAITNALAQRGRQARRCYESQLANDPSLHVKMSINVKVGTNGSLCSSAVTETSNDAVSRCVLNFFRAGSYPAPKGCIANVTVPLNFVPR